VKETQITKLSNQAQMSSLKQPVLRNEGEIFWWKIRTKVLKWFETRYSRKYIDCESKEQTSSL